MTWTCKLALAAGLAALLAGAQQGPIINAADYGLREGQDATPPIREAIEAAKAKGAAKLVLPRGTYHFDPHEAFEKWCHISNHDNSLKRIAFPLLGFDGLEVEGNGSSLVYKCQIVPFVLEGSRNITLRNFSIDWDKPFNLQARVIARDAANNSFDLEVSPENVYEIWGDELIFLEKPSHDPWFWNARGVPRKKDDHWAHNINWNIFWDPVTRAVAYGAHDYQAAYFNRKLNKRYLATELKPGVVRFKDATNEVPPVGWVFISKGKRDFQRLYPAIRVLNTFNLRVEDVTVHHAGGMGLIAERSGDIVMERFRITPTPGKNRLVSVPCDATHFTNCRGSIHFNDCLFEQMMDDGTNVHGVYTTVARVVDEHTVGIDRMHTEQMGFEFAAPGDTLRFGDPKTLKPYLTLTATAVEYINEEYMEVKFAEPVKGKIIPGSSVDNPSWQADVLMENTTIRNNLARSVLLSQARSVVIRNCRFIRNSEPAVLAGGAGLGLFHESGPSENILIENTYIEDPGLGGRGDYAIRISAASRDTPPDYYFKRNVRFLNNTMNLFAGRVLSIRGIEGFVFSGNTINQTTQFGDGEPSAPAITVAHCKDVTIENNNYNWKHPAKLDIASSVRNLVVKGNKGIPDLSRK